MAGDLRPRSVVYVIQNWKESGYCRNMFGVADPLEPHTEIDSMCSTRRISKEPYPINGHCSVNIW